MAITYPVSERRQRPAGALDDLARRKLEAFERIEQEFISSFLFVQYVHGQRRFTSFPVVDTVRYLHALYICECKDRLLSVPQTIQRYDGERCLTLLRDWQGGRMAGAIGFIYERLDDQPFGELTQRIEEATISGDLRLARRLVSGRTVLLNRLFNLASALDAIFTLEPRQLHMEVRAACKRFGHTRAQIKRQLAEMRTDLYSYARHPALARRNMIVMNSIGLRVTDVEGDRPGERTDRVRPPALPVASYADAPIPDERTLLSLHWVPRIPRRPAGLVSG
jgi:hypothetical protein